MTRDDTVTLALDGDVSLATFREAIDGFQTLVDALAEHAGAPGQIRWLIEDLGAGSATATVRGEPTTPDAERLLGSVIDSFLSVGQSLAEGKTPPVSPKATAAAHELASIIDGEVTAVRFETAVADAVVSAPVQPELVAPRQGPRTAFGAVRGRIQTLTNRGSLRFTLWDSLHDKPVSVYLAADQEAMMRDAWGRVAVVEGQVTRDPVTGRPLSIRHVKLVTILPEGEPFGYRRARGALPRRQQSSELPETVIRRLRDE